MTDPRRLDAKGRDSNPVIKDFFSSWTQQALGDLKLWLEDELEFPPCCSNTATPTLYMASPAPPITLVSGVEQRVTFPNVYNNTLGVSINGTSDVFTMPSATPELIYGSILAANIVDNTVGTTAAFEFYAKGWCATGNGGNDVMLPPSVFAKNTPFSWSGYNPSGGFWSVDVFQNSGKDLLFGCELFAWPIGPDGF